MRVTFGGQPCLDPFAFWEFCRTNNHPIEPWFGRANSFSCPLGQEPGYGYVLMTRGDLDELDVNAEHTLIFEYDERVDLRRLSIAQVLCVSPGSPADPDAAYLLTLTDRRAHLQNSAIDRAFNIRTNPSGSYDSGTTDPDTSSAWTWGGMARKIWVEGLTEERAGDWPGLPGAVEGTPENFKFYGYNAWDALGVVLQRVGCAVKLDPTTDAFSIVPIGGEEAVQAAKHDKLYPERIWDSYPSAFGKVRLPAQVRVHFWYHVRAVNEGENTAYFVDLADPEIDEETYHYDDGTIVCLYDDELAAWNGTTASNAATLALRAADRATAYYRSLKTGTPNKLIVYHDIRSVFPWEQQTATIWHDLGSGFKTEVVRSRRPVAQQDDYRHPFFEWPSVSGPAGPSGPGCSGAHPECPSGPSGVSGPPGPIGPDYSGPASSGPSGASGPACSGAHPECPSGPSGPGLEIGTILMFSGTVLPYGWLWCDGATYDGSDPPGTYTNLWTSLGTTFGGTGQSSFKVPNTASRSPLGAGAGSGLTSRSLGATGGVETHALSEAEMASHSHPTANSTYFLTGTTGNVVESGGATGGHATDTGTTGSGTAHANMHPWMGVNFIIRYANSG